MTPRECRCHLICLNTFFFICCFFNLCCVQRHATDVGKGESAAGVSATSDNLTHEAKDDQSWTTLLQRGPFGDSFAPIQPSESNKAIDQEIDMLQGRDSPPTHHWNGDKENLTFIPYLHFWQKLISGSCYLRSKRACFFWQQKILWSELLPESVDVLILLKKKSYCPVKSSCENF